MARRGSASSTAVLAEQVAVVAPEDDDRVVGEPQPIERLEHPADLGVHEGDRGVIGLDRPPRCAFASTPQLGGVVNQAASARLRGRFGNAAAESGSSIERIQVEILLRRDVRAVRPVEAGGEEERPVLVLLEELDGLGGDLAVGLLLVGAGERSKAERAAQAAVGREVGELRPRPCRGRGG